jgi:hypothetical protein
LRFLALALSFLAAGSAWAQDTPPLDMLKTIIGRLEGPVPPATISFALQAGGSSEVCNMTPYSMLLSQGEKARKYPVLLNRQEGSSVVPQELFAVVNRIVVDADGSARAYHPEDPDGDGTCQQIPKAGGGTTLNGICALDSFPSGQIHLFRGVNKLRKPDLAPAWKEFWPLIRDHRLKSVPLKDLAEGPNVPVGYHLFYSREKNMTAFFKETIIPLTIDAYPCLHDEKSNAPGYFIAATTLTKEGPTRADGCAPSRFFDAEETPFFVLPGVDLGKIQIGDIVIARLKHAGQDRTVFGVAGDNGPVNNFGEASIAFNQALLGRSHEKVMNSNGANALDIARPVSILILGGTKHLLHDDYSRANIEAVGREVLSNWSGGNPSRRLDACAAQAGLR